MKKGKGYLILSAFVYGLSPVLAKIAYESGSNGLTVVFYRSAISVPLLFLLVAAKRKSIELPKRIVKAVVACGILSAASMVLLYAAYDLISVGTATTLHFIYPVLIAVYCALFYNERLSVTTVVAMLLITAGIAMQGGRVENINFEGIMLAVFSGVLYAAFVICLGKSGADEYEPYLITLYISMVSSILLFAVGIIGGDFAISIRGSGWISQIVISLLANFVAMPCFQKGIRYEGASVAGIISSAEPIVAVGCGILVLGENLSFVGAIGCIIMFLGLVFLAKSPNEKKTRKNLKKSVDN